MRRALALLVLATTLMVSGLVVGPPPAAAAPSLELGFADPKFAVEGRDAWLDRAKAVRAGAVRIDSGWTDIAPTRPANPRDPADPAYRWQSADAGIRAAAARGFKVVFLTTAAPGWAEGPSRPSAIAPGAWKPDPGALGDFAAAVAKRYDGSYPDPAAPGATLPRIAAFQVWNEPNLDGYLAPQWQSRRPFAPGRYREMLRAAYLGAHAGSSRPPLILTAGTAPYGDPNPGGSRIRPLRFWREMLCLSARLKKVAGCSEPAMFDIYAHHPYAIDGPYRAAFDRDDIALPDVDRVVAVVKAAITAGTARPRKPKPLWITEVSWDSSPPDPNGIPAVTHARWLAEAFDVLWRDGARLVLWFQVGDAPPPFPSSNQSGVFLRDGRRKRAAASFEFPLSCSRDRRGRVRAWTRAPQRGSLVLRHGDRRAGRRVAAGAVVTATLGAGAGRLTASLGSQRRSTSCPSA